MQMVMYVINNPDLLDDVLDAWHDMGITGVTIFESTGIYRRRPKLVSARYSFGFPMLVQTEEKGHFTLFAMVPDMEAVQRCIQLTESIVGDLHKPNTGAFAAWELTASKRTIWPSDEQDDAPGADGSPSTESGAQR